MCGRCGWYRGWHQLTSRLAGERHGFGAAVGAQQLQPDGGADGAANEAIGKVMQAGPLVGSRLDSGQLGDAGGYRLAVHGREYVTYLQALGS